MLHRLAADKNVSAVLVRIDSPGGSMPAAISLYNALRAVAQKKPVIAVMEEMAASAGYLAAIGADYIIANPATLTGSVGVFIPLVDATELAKSIGVRSRTVSSGEHKLATSPVDKVSEKSATYLQNMVDELHQLFIHYVSERRQITDISAVTTGRAFTGTQAKKIGLVDALGGEIAALAWLDKKEIAAPIHWYKIKKDTPWINQFLGGFLPINSNNAHGAIAAIQY